MMLACYNFLPSQANLPCYHDFAVAEAMQHLTRTDSYTNRDESAAQAHVESHENLDYTLTLLIGEAGLIGGERVRFEEVCNKTYAPQRRGQ